MEHEVEKALDRFIRPKLRKHFGDIEVTRIESGTVYVRMRGRCASCISAQYTVEHIVEQELLERVPEVQNVSIDTFDPELFQMAQKILQHELPLTSSSPEC